MTSLKLKPLDAIADPYFPKEKDRGKDVQPNRNVAEIAEA
jgi:hypothetical protein